MSTVFLYKKLLTENRFSMSFGKTVLNYFIKSSKKRSKMVKMYIYILPYFLADMTFSGLNIEHIIRINEDRAFTENQHFSHSGVSLHKILERKCFFRTKITNLYFDTFCL